jgi:hypothetical protein
MKVALFAHNITHNIFQYSVLEVSTNCLTARSYVVASVPDAGTNSFLDTSICSFNCLSPFFATKPSADIKSELLEIFNKYDLILGCNKQSRAFIQYVLPHDTRVQFNQVEVTDIQIRPLCLCHVLKSCPFREVFDISEHLRKSNYSLLPDEAEKPAPDSSYHIVLK